MVFSDLFFLFGFLPAFLLCYLLSGAIDRLTASDAVATVPRCKNLCLVLFSLIFYAWGEPVYVFLMLGCVVLNYFSGLCIARANRYRKAALVFGLAGNIAILSVFKYAAFFAQILQSLGLPVAVPHLALPIGISFYIFQSISYLVDVYRKESSVQRGFLNLLLYISMFPQLVAGPIVRYGSVEKEITSRRIRREDVADGLYRFLLGLGKKVILANQFSDISDQFLSHGLGDLSVSGAWIGILAFTLQIYFDFSGYSDMAIGLGRCIGFHFPENFNHPYCSRSITEFWRRWHMTLGGFFRDYVYIPLGGNRRHQPLNILVVWFLTGMWHGASWNFILWGLYFGLIVMIEKYTILKVKEHIPAFLLHLYSLLLIIVGWGIFYFEDFVQMHRFFRSFAGMEGELTNFVSEAALTDHFLLWVVALIFCMPLRGWAADTLAARLNERGTLYISLSLVAKILISAFLFVLSVALLVGATNNAFIYTRF